ncbi:hypothetical protein Mp_4g12730 [Marchantia polymorpha subsp. ruderalis]|uniref:Uncharacterized protein n=1 Tax=Marchantia polymorpha subsp. ruderalis TaxID=1480154 RepID=A0AAF6B9A0_MARPO|nr:hypothetical protein Mp_4g12730 [Marchantia polymorpha subsp. ruderalis]
MVQAGPRTRIQWRFFLDSTRRWTDVRRNSVPLTPNDRAKEINSFLQNRRCSPSRVRCSTNFDHLEAVFGLLQNPLVSGVTAVMHNFAVSALESSADERELSNEEQPVAHVDVACMLHGRPVWLVVSTRNPRYIMWQDSDKSGKGLRSRLLVLLNAASADAVKQPASILLCFLCDVDDGVDRGLRDYAECHGRSRKFLNSEGIVQAGPRTRIQWQRSVSRRTEACLGRGIGEGGGLRGALGLGVHVHRGAEASD